MSLGFGFVKQRPKSQNRKRNSPGSSLPSSQSHESSFTSDHGMDLEPSRHVHRSEWVVYLESRLGGTPWVLGIWTEACVEEVAKKTRERRTGQGAMLARKGSTARPRGADVSFGGIT